MVSIDQALLTSFINGAFGLPIAHQNIDYTPAVGTAYAQIYAIQNDITARTLSDSNETDGVFRVNLYYPVGIGAIVPKQKADDIFNVFKIGSRHIYSGVSLTVTGNYTEQSTVLDGWFILTLSITYRSFITR